MTMRRRRWLGAFFFALMFGHLGVNAYSAWLSLKTWLNGSSDGWTARLSPDGRAHIASVDRNGPATALQMGDEFVSINGLTLRDDPEIRSYNQRVPPGTRYTIVVRRQGQPLEFSLTTVGYPVSRWLMPIAEILVQFLFLATGLIIFLLKPGDRQAWLLVLMLGLFPALFNTEIPPLPLAILFLMAVARIMGIWLVPVFCHFFLIFPDRSPLLRRFPILERGLYLPFLLVLPWYAFGRIVVIFREREQVAQFFQNTWVLQQKWIALLSLLTVLAYLAIGLVALFASYRVAGVASRRKLHVIVAGSGAGFFNLLLLIVWETFLNNFVPEAGEWIMIGLKFTLPLIPLSFAYAIVRHQVIPVSLIIRRSVRYLLVSRGAILLDMIAVGLSVTAMLTYIFSRTRPPVIVIGLVSAAVGIVVWKIASRLHEKFLSPLIDRRFFRQSYDAQQIIAELTGSLRTVTGLPELLELVAIKIQTALQTVNVTIFLRDKTTGNYHSAYSRDFSETDGRAVSHSRNCWLSKSITVIEQESDNGYPVEIAPAEIGLDGSIINDRVDGGLNGSIINDRVDSGLDGSIINNDRVDGGATEGALNGRDGDGMLATDRETLRELKATLLMPLASKQELLGIISLGPRLGDLPFSREDKQLLMSVSGPTAFAIENARLVEHMVAEARRLQEIEIDHRRKTEELAFARQLQLSMLPTRNVSLDNMEIIGQMRTATEVGGDYYDFIEMADGRICLAVGDATGHGMAAGLVVGMVKMGLINGLQRANGQASVKLVVEDLNRALRRSLSQRGMGMCLGAAILDTSTLKVEVISNGMPAPYHYRAASRSLSPIATQAPPLGFLRQVNVRPVEAQLRSGDALIWLSDGFEERLNNKNDVWGSEQVEETLERICGEESSGENIARRMIEACDDAAGGRGNDDDMTIVVAKVKAD